MRTRRRRRGRNRHGGGGGGMEVDDGMDKEEYVRRRWHGGKGARRQVGREKGKYEALVDSVNVKEGYSGSRLMVRNF
jgi:hypothetical protein